MQYTGNDFHPAWPEPRGVTLRDGSHVLAAVLADGRVLVSMYDYDSNQDLHMAIPGDAADTLLDTLIEVTETLDGGPADAGPEGRW